MVVQRAGLDGQSSLRWGLNHAEDVLSWDDRFRLLEVITYFGDRRLGLKLRLMGLLSDLLRAQYMIYVALGGTA